MDQRLWKWDPKRTSQIQKWRKCDGGNNGITSKLRSTLCDGRDRSSANRKNEKCDDGEGHERETALLRWGGYAMGGKCDSAIMRFAVDALRGNTWLYG